MSFLNTTAKIEHRTVLPANISKEDALKVFHNHELLIRLDKDLIKYETITPKKAEQGSKCYQVTAKVQGVPGIGSSIAYNSTITNMDNGVKWLIDGAMGVEQRSSWTLEPATDKDEVEGDKSGRLVIVEVVDIKASRLLMGTVKGRCEAAWKRNHEELIGHMKGEKQAAA